jgi:hypothetical protein
MKQKSIDTELAREAVRNLAHWATPELRDKQNEAIILSAIREARQQPSGQDEKIVLEAIAAYMQGTSSEKVTDALDNLLRESCAIDKEIKSYEQERRAEQPAQQEKLTDSEVERFLKEYDEGKHQVPTEYAIALEKAKPELFRKITRILNAAYNASLAQQPPSNITAICPHCGKDFVTGI